MRSRAHLDKLKGVELPQIITQSLPHCFSMRRTKFWNWCPEIDCNKSILKNGISDILRNYRRRFPSLAHDKTTRIYPEMLSLSWRCSKLKMARCRIWIRRNIWSWGMSSLPQWCNRKIRAKRRNRFIKNSGLWHQCQEGRLCFLLRVSFTCIIIFILPYPRTWESPQK